MNVALYQPEIPQNTAAILRTAVCLGADVDIIGPASFDLSQRAVRRAGLDYAQNATIKRHASFEEFCAARRRVVLFTTHASTLLPDFAFAADDTLLFGRESAGVPDAVYDACEHRVRIPLAAGARSLNLAVAVGIGLFAALSSSRSFPEKGPT